MDAMMTAKGDVWNPPEEVVNNCNQEVDQVLRYVPMILPCPTRHHNRDRVLRPNGTFIYLTFGQPHFRRRYLQREKTILEIKELGETFHYYLYALRKRTEV